MSPAVPGSTCSQMQCLSGSLFCARVPVRSFAAHRLHVLQNTLRLTKADGREDREDEVEAHHLPAQEALYLSRRSEANQSQGH